MDNTLFTPFLFENAHKWEFSSAKSNVAMRIRNAQRCKTLPYTATSFSVAGRLIFMFLLYKNKSTNSLSLLFCILSILSSSMWLYYSIVLHDLPLIVRSSTEISLLSISSVYIIRNKINYKPQILPT
jgi:uncharacterized protein with PQ loop repeat